jgi:hypothetical protein
MKTAFIYRGHDTISDYFLDQAVRDFRVEVINIGRRSSIDRAAKHWWNDYGPKPTAFSTIRFLCRGDDAPRNR